MDEFTKRMNDELAMHIGQLVLDNTAMKVQLHMANTELAELQGKARDANAPAKE